MQKKKPTKEKQKRREKEKEKGKYTLEALESASCLPDDEEKKEYSNANQSKPEKKKQKLPFDPFAFPRDIIPCSVV
jgi:hypothetical protein